MFNILSVFLSYGGCTCQLLLNEYLIFTFIRPITDNLNAIGHAVGQDSETKSTEHCPKYKQELSKPRLATPLHAYVLVTYLLIYLGTYLFTRLHTRYVLQPLLYKLSKIVLI